MRLYNKTCMPRTRAAAVGAATVSTFASGWDAAMQSTAVDMKFVMVVKSSAGIQSTHKCAQSSSINVAVSHQTATCSVR